MVTGGSRDDSEITANEDNEDIVFRKSPQIPQGLNPRFFEVLQDNVNQYRKTIEDLKDK